MGSIGPAEIIVVLIVGLIVLGPNRLPEAAKQIGKAVSEFRRMTSGIQAEMRDAFTEPVPGTPPAPTSPAVGQDVAAVVNPTDADVAAAAPAEPATPEPGVTDIAATPSRGPAPWANPAIPVEGPPEA